VHTFPQGACGVTRKQIARTRPDARLVRELDLRHSRSTQPTGTYVTIGNVIKGGDLAKGAGKTRRRSPGTH
jgi:hypothetical protein